MKILVLAPQPFFQDRGTPIATLKLLHVLANGGHEMDLLTFREGEPIAVPNCRHHRVAAIPFVHNVPPGFSFKKLLCDVVMTVQTLTMCFRKDYDLIHAVEESVFIAMLAKIVFGVPYVYDMDSSLPNQLQERFSFLRVVAPVLRIFEGSAVRNSRGVVAVCQSLEDIAADHCDAVPIVRIEDASLLTTKASSGGEREGQWKKCTLPTAIDGPLLMYVGNLQSYQGIDLLLDSFVHVYYRKPDAHLVIVGGSTEDVRQYSSRAEEIGIANRTHFIGPRPVDELGQWLEAADVLVSPRTQGNNTPMKIFSYLESGTPLLATRLSMHTQILDEEVAVLAEPNPLEMADGICLLFENPDLCADLATSARQRARSCFDAAMLDARLSEFYQELALALGCR